MTSTTEFPFHIKQSDQQGCIPTNISATLQALEIPGITECHLFRAYFSTICFSNIIHLKVLDAIPFNGQKLSDLLDLDVYIARSFEDWWSYVTYCLQSHRFVLFAFKVPGGSHIRTAVHLVSSSNTIETYDPNPNLQSTAISMSKEELATWWSSGKLNHDLLWICKR